MTMDPLTILLYFLIAIFALIGGGIAWLIYQKDRNINKQLEINSAKESKAHETKAAMPREDVRKFLEFDKIEDDMIIQEKGNRFVMVMKCQGINYDLMSNTEMLAVEEGFSNFLNTLKHPIQLYVQARSLDMEEGINQYKTRIKKLAEEYEKLDMSIAHAKRTKNLTSKEKEQLDFELKKKRTLLEYGSDIVNYVEKMSLNRNILQRKYYIVVAYHTSELGLTTNFTKEEAHDLAYSELYTRCRTISAALVSCGIESAILKSEELAELLYVAYNKDESDKFNLRKALENGFYRLYSTAQDVLEKKQIAMDNAVRDQAVAEAELALQKAIAQAREQNNGLTYEEKMNDAAKAQAMQIILDNSDQFEDEVVDTALSDLNNQMNIPIIDPNEVEELRKDNSKKGNTNDDVLTQRIDDSEFKEEEGIKKEDDSLV